MGYIYVDTNCARAQARVATKKNTKCQPGLEATPPDAQNTRAHKNSVIYYTMWQIAEPRLALAAANREKKKRDREESKASRNLQGPDVEHPGSVTGVLKSQQY